MKRFFRIMSIFIVCIMMLSFSACKGSKKTDKQDSILVKGDADIDLEGQTIIISIPEYMHPEIHKLDHQGWTYEDSEYDLKYKELLLKRLSEVEKKFNCKIECNTNNLAVFNNVNNKGEKADILYCGGDNVDFIRLIMENIIVPLDDYIDFSSEVLSNSVQNCALWKDKHYGIYKDPINFAGPLLVYNKDFIEKEGLPDPLELLKTDQWTWDAFLDILKAATKDLNNDGTIDRWGYANDGYQSVFLNYLFTNGASYIEYEDGKFQFVLDRPEAKYAINFAKDIYKTYKVAPDTTVNAMGWEDISRLFETGNCIFKDYWGETSEDFDFEVGLVTFPKGPDASSSIQYTTPGGFYAVASSTKNPEGVAVVMAELFTLYDKSRDEYISEEDLIKTYIPEEYVDIFTDISKNIKYNWFLDSDSQFGQTLSSIFGQVMLKDKSLEEAINEQKASLDTMINGMNK